MKVEICLDSESQNSDEHSQSRDGDQGDDGANFDDLGLSLCSNDTSRAAIALPGAQNYGRGMDRY